MPEPGKATPEHVLSLLLQHVNRQNIIACQPDDWADFPIEMQPAHLGVEAPVMDEGWVGSSCMLCDCKIRVGNRQQQAIKAFGPDKCMLVDLACAALMTKVMYGDQGEDHVHSLGAPD